MNAQEFAGAVARFWAHVDRGAPDACWPWTGETNNQGYGRLDFHAAGRRTRLFAHRVAFLLHGGELAATDKVLHRCDNPPCCNPGHLRAGTQKDNIQDAARRGRLNLSGLAIGQLMSTVYRGPIAACGTESGEVRHRRHGEPPCDACREARRDAERRRRAARKAIA